MSMKVLKPTWERIPSGTGLRVAREGVIFLEFANSRGERDYDWEGKQSFALSAVECAELMDLAASGVDKAFYHDANKMSSNEGSIVKQLRVSSVRDSSTGGYFFNLSVNNKISNVQTKFDIFVSQAEMRLIQSIMNYAIPRILGFDEKFAGAPDVKESLPSSPETTGDRPPF